MPPLAASDLRGGDRERAQYDSISCIRLLLALNSTVQDSALHNEELGLVRV